MTEILKIAEPVKDVFCLCRDEFLKILNSETPLLQSTIAHIMNTKGKRIRPLLLLLTAKACGKVTPQAIEYGAVIEMLHTATLIHDDVIDETKQRRGRTSLNAVYDNRISVLTGDFLFAGALQKACEMGNLFIVNMVSNVCRALSEGEMMEIDNAGRHSLDEDNYMKMIRKKTASLISVCAEIGAVSAGASPEIISACRTFGEYLGYCFQIKDDIFDYYDDAAIGKPTGNDIREGKITLPLLYALNTSAEAEHFCNIIERQDFTPDNVAALIDFAKRSGGIEYAKKMLSDYKSKAKELINTLHDSDARNSLLLLADYFADRKY
ncbi:MAG: polyprenyl synthetase family protein [Tannerella sp.]|jgi:octaprenyl-diphosphate synthase|nr:polyprenyl synthetase family protein [Tannerella sp.]